MEINLKQETLWQECVGEWKKNVKVYQILSHQMSWHLFIIKDRKEKTQSWDSS